MIVQYLKEVFPGYILFGTAIWLPHGQLCATVKGTASKPNVNHCLLFLFDLKVTGSLVQHGWIPKPSQAASGVWTGILPILNVTTYSTGPFSLAFIVYEPLDYSTLVFNLYSSFLGWFFVWKFCFFIIIIFFFCKFCNLVDWFSNGIHYKVQELLAKMKVSVLVI